MPPILTSSLPHVSPCPDLSSAGLCLGRWQASAQDLYLSGFHALRHHFVSVWLADGVDVRSLAEFLGHHDPGFTLRTYTHLMPSGGERMRKAIDRAFSAAPADGLPVDASAFLCPERELFGFPARSTVQRITRRSTARTRAGADAGGSGRSRTRACRRSRSR
ncbi:tyrosine-type recombinase/integrase [Sphaerisporangium rubeum]|uniref:tyrosine-type recombinase/integrase n=1 Tax=Sphaerisporangium rubeum TaxID=321317 RepID=UPI00160CF0C8|nr:tyrosine-type recombinase/integrase [Sphaerisporangium rubeum]